MLKHRFALFGGDRLFDSTFSAGQYSRLALKANESKQRLYSVIICHIPQFSMHYSGEVVLDALQHRVVVRQTSRGGVLFGSTFYDIVKSLNAPSAEKR